MARGQSVDAAMDLVFLAPSATSNAAGLQQQLRRQGVQSDAVVLIDDVDPALRRSRLAEALRGRQPAGELPDLAVLDAGIVVNDPPLGAVLDDPRIGTAALSAAQDGRQVHLGVLKLAGPDRATAAVLLTDLSSADLPKDDLFNADLSRVEPGDLLLALTRALTAAGTPVQPVPLGGYLWGRPDGSARAAAEAKVAALDERTVRLREAARGGDGFYSSFVLRKLSWRLTGLAERTGVTPNQVTLISFALGLIAAGFLAVGDRPAAVAGALLLQVCLVVDCVDGELARYRRRFSRFGAWLDATTDRVKEFAAIGALALGAVPGGSVGDRHSDAGLWWLAGAAIAVQTFRNLFDLGWSFQRSAGSSAASAAAVPAAVDWVAGEAGMRARAGRQPGPGARNWLRRIGHFPIGERFLLISLGAAFWTARGTLIALLVIGLLSAGYMLAAFAVRSAAPTGSAASTGSGRRITALADSGPLLGAVLGRLAGDRAGRLSAVFPALVALTELGLIWALAAELAGARRSAVVVLVAVTAIAHYQHAYGVREDDGAGSDEDGGKPGIDGVFGVFGTDLRLAALVVGVVAPAALLGPGPGGHWATVTVWVLSVVIAVSSTIRSLRVWTGRGRQNVGVDNQPWWAARPPRWVRRSVEFDE